MASRIGTPLPRAFIVTIYVYIAAGVAVISAVTALNGTYGWAPAIVAACVALVFLAIPNLGPRGTEFVQVDDEGVAVKTDQGIERVAWSDIQRVRILTTDAGPWSEDAFFLLEAAGNKGCAVPNDAAVRTKLLDELQTRLKGVRDEKVIEAMGCTSNNSFTIWEKGNGDAT
jgi:hypothetical protein